jgi:hypothetical protein
VRKTKQDAFCAECTCFIGLGGVRDNLSESQRYYAIPTFADMPDMRRIYLKTGPTKPTPPPSGGSERLKYSHDGLY